ncbi:unnamed protein product [Pleuronectes platessa]|uniref:Striatin N-terminal domain-containing protein n=1 Tax=Pleuronectes platessa TaxID=8262 RepID=A0A9N7TTF2_PLEPL|nr:unnamed protein product [Pleuronectes platessa]
MDEQAGPGVFFGGSNSPGLAGGVRAPKPGDGVGEAARAHYSVPGILHFLQHEWARVEVQRAQWEVERAELQVSDRHSRSIVGQGVASYAPLNAGNAEPKRV